MANDMISVDAPLDTVPAYFIDGEAVDAALSATQRVYLVGHLKRNQPQLDHVGALDSPVEMGITRYDEFTVDTPHYHRWNTDFTLVQRGVFMVRIIPTGEVRVMEEGSLCVINPGIAHVCIAMPGTQVLFFKTPGGNDKVVVDLDEASSRWVKETHLNAKP